MVWSDPLLRHKTSPMNHAVTIAGGGLAGLSLGIALRMRGVPVTLHEAGTYPRHRVCGEFISGVTDSTLETLGIAEDLAPATPLASAVWHDTNGRVCELQVAGQGISRWRLDDALQRRFTTLGGTLATHSRIAPAPGTIWAAGRPRRQGPWIGLKCHATNLTLTHDLEMHLGSNGYLGLAHIEDGKVNICGLFKKSPARGAKGTALLTTILREGGLNNTADRLESATLDSSAFCGVAGFEMGRQPSEGFSIGDATHMIPPFTGNGMSMAFESAGTALPHALAYARGECSWDSAASACAADLDNRFRTRMLASAAIHTLLTSPMASRLATTLARFSLPPVQPLLHLLR